MICPRCRATVVATARVCPVCGQALEGRPTTPLVIDYAPSADAPRGSLHEATTVIVRRAPSEPNAPAQPLSHDELAAVAADIGRALVVPQWRRWWWKMLLIGMALYLAIDRVWLATGNLFLLPQLFVIGTFLVPIVYTAYLYEDGTLYDVPLTHIALIFFFGGVLGSLAASLLESRLITSTGAGFFGQLSLSNALIVGVSEELAKLMVVLPFLGWVRRRFPTLMHGIVLGAAAGMGFAAFESMGYAFYALINQNAAAMHDTIRLRALLAPLGHGTWTAIVAGAIWRERLTHGHPLTANALVAFLIAAGLHMLWDYVPAITLRGIPLLHLLIGAIGLLILRFFLLAARGHDGPAYRERALWRALRLYFTDLWLELQRLSREPSPPRRRG